jgi:hypothetical protein
MRRHQVLMLTFTEPRNTEDYVDGFYLRSITTPFIFSGEAMYKADEAAILATPSQYFPHTGKFIQRLRVFLGLIAARCSGNDAQLPFNRVLFFDGGCDNPSRSYRLL